LELFNAVASLSYRGDFRMFVGEDKMKVSNIVKGNLPQFHDLYSPFLSLFIENLSNNQLIKRRGITVQSCQHYIPEVVKQSILHGKSLQTALSIIVRKSSIQQSVKGILTAGW
jgi:translocator assembly and maintenance protein 41